MNYRNEENGTKKEKEEKEEEGEKEKERRRGRRRGVGELQPRGLGENERKDSHAPGETGHIILYIYILMY